jgi:photosystem II stability/assembly factor-like uncharacterized protein
MHSFRCAAALLLLVPTWAFAADKEKEHSEFDGLKYRSVGPAAGGRVSRVAGVPGDPLTYYAATAAGGVWKSEDGGVTFKPIFDDQPISSIGSIAVAPSDPNVVYVGSGEANIRGNVAAGNGIYKSTDAGKTWQQVWKEIGHIGAMAVHPKDPDTAFAAVLGHAFGPNPERGIYRTIDGGRTWQRVLFKDNDTGACDVCIDPNNPRIVFAGLWQTRRKPWDLTSGGPGSGLYVSHDGGDTWDQLGPTTKKRGDKEWNGLPPGPWGKIGIAVAPSNSNRIYALIEAEDGGLYRSDDGGGKWERVSDDHALRQRLWYFGTLTVDPQNPDVVYAPQVRFLRSIDGGRTFKRFKGTHHGDHHDLWIDPKNPKRMIAADDGGVDVTNNGGGSWYAPPLPIAQFYHVACDERTPYRVMGCMQDLGTASGPSNSLCKEGILLGDWHAIGGGEAGYAVPDPFDPDIVYAGEYGGYISRYDHRTRQARNISIYPYDPSGHGAEDLKYRFQWTAPILVSRHDGTVYHGANVLFRSRDGGLNWEPIGPDLTRNDKQKQKWSGGPITGDNTGVEVYGTIFALAESPKDANVLWAGSDDGLVQVTRDRGKSWQNVTPNLTDLPDWGTVSCIETSPHDASTAYVVVDAHRLDDYRPYLWKTTDFGKTWKKLTEGLPPDVYLHAVREDPKKKGLLFLGTERGVTFSPDDGATWKALKLNLPTVAVHDLVVKDNDLVLGTNGRSIWIMDDITPIREFGKSVAGKRAYLFSVQPAIRWRYHSTVTAHQERGSGENPPGGAIISYYLKEKPKKPLRIEVLDAKGNKVISFDGKEAKPEPSDDGSDESEPEKPKPEIPAEPGINRFVWDLLHKGAELIPKAKADSGDIARGPFVAPGTYTVNLTVDGRVLSTKLDVSIDARVTESQYTRQHVVLRPTANESAGVLLPIGAPGVLGLPAWQWVPLTGKEDEARRVKELLRSVGPLELVIGPGLANGEAAPMPREKDPGGAFDQEKLALKLRDDVTQLTHTVEQVRAIRKQLRLHAELLKDEPKAKELLKKGKALNAKLGDLEAKLHNPKAKVVYDILAQKGGARLYSQLIFLFEAVAVGDGPPTQGMKELAADLEKELNELTAEFDQVRTGDVPKLNELAKSLSAPTIWIPEKK